MNAKERLSNKVILVTGGARGLGAAIAHRLVAEGASVVTADVLDDQGQALAAELGKRAQYVHLDVREQGEWAQAVATTMAAFGRIDVLVNNAAVLRAGTVADMPVDVFRFVTEVNYIGSYLGMRSVIPHMLAAGKGSIVNIASVNGLVGSPYFAAYAGSKHAVLGMTKSAAMELAASAVRVNAICPGAMDTPMVREASEMAGVDASATLSGKIPMGRVARPEEVAGMVVYLASDDSSYCTGATYAIDGGLTAGFSLM